MEKVHMYKVITASVPATCTRSSSHSRDAYLSPTPQMRTAMQGQCKPCKSSLPCSNKSPPPDARPAYPTADLPILGLYCLHPSPSSISPNQFFPFPTTRAASAAILVHVQRLSFKPLSPAAARFHHGYFFLHCNAPKSY
ncbi:hypothetical protein K504DRAFT_460171 [Pleomassaria siparia CBS 279.74]|uniref:Uncharacterized protein n=1 Tax=Pleomassaria siparia CBS 279.74 TaxID=1314801 RepID=A0A6G1JZP9_9PLEO|nr:hypothetical protein K504DRAFT_460171 [Pleomassaria siparia CBS 279.74]